MSQNAITIVHYKLPDLDYGRLSYSQRREVAELMRDMNQVRAAVTAGRFQSLTTVEDALTYLRHKAEELGTALPESFLRDIRTAAVTRSLEQAERYPQIVQEGRRLVERAREGLNASDQGRYRFFAGKARAYFEEHQLPADELDRMDAQARVNPFFDHQSL